MKKIRCASDVMNRLEGMLNDDFRHYHEFDFLFEKLEHMLKIEKRWHESLEQDEAFSELDVRKILDLQDGLLERFRLAYGECLELKARFDRLYADTGNSIYRDYDIRVDWAVYPNLPDVDETMLEYLSEKCGESLPKFCMRGDAGGSCETFEKYMDLDANCNHDNPFWREEFADKKIYFFMHEMFGDDSKSFTVGDALNMRPEDLRWQVIVDFEKSLDVLE